MSPAFTQLGVPDQICDALERGGITEPFEIQAATIADAMAGRDVCGRAPTGSGKTLAFGIPLVAMAERAEPKRPRALVLAPTRELAEQIAQELRTFAGNVRIGAVYGGVGYGPQLKALRQGVEILVACPGRLEDLIEQGSLTLSSVEHVVLDEADRMADMGFIPAVRRLLDQTAAQRQTVLFSATLDGDVAKLTRDYQRDPVHHEVGEETPDITAANHVFWKVPRAERASVTAEAVNAVWPAIIFCRTRHGSDRLAKQLGRAGIEAAAIHGGRSQSQRTRALSAFSKGRVHALVATDVAARGIHVDGVASVVHYDPPEDHKAYVHRSGRTARAGQGGIVLSLVQPEQVRDLKKLQRRVELEEPFVEPDAAALRDLSPAPNPGHKPAGENEQQSNRHQPDRGQPRPKRQKQDGNRNSSRNDPRRSASSSGRSNAKSGSKPKPKSGSRDTSGRSNSSKQAGPTKGSNQSKDSSRSKQSKQANTNGKSSTNGRSQSSNNGQRPNRKARRAHMQPGTPS
jgi:superfamily II DNA/RNA helicase